MNPSVYGDFVAYIAIKHPFQTEPMALLLWRHDNYTYIKHTIHIIPLRTPSVLQSGGNPFLNAHMAVHAIMAPLSTQTHTHKHIIPLCTP